MKVTRKFNLARIGPAHQYETVDIEIEAEKLADIIVQIDDAWKAYCKLIQNGVVQ